MTPRTFGQTGYAVTPLGIGCTDSVEVINTLLDAGANLVDTAQCYGSHEEFLGTHFRARRADFFLQSKCGHHDVLPDGSLRSRRIRMADIDQALHRLQTDYLDAMLLHSYDLDALRDGEAISVLEAAKREGKIRFIGYSGDNERALYAARHPAFDLLETSLNLADQRQIETLLPLCAERGLAVVAKRPVANAAWRALDGDGPFAAKATVYTRRLAAMNLSLTDLGFSETPDGWTELALRFVLSIPGLHCAIIGTRNPDHARKNIQLAAQGPLPEETMSKLRQTFQEAERTSGTVWPGEN